MSSVGQCHKAVISVYFRNTDDHEATAHSIQRAAWLALQHQLSAVGGRILLADADDKQKVSTMSAEAIS